MSMQLLKNIGVVVDIAYRKTIHAFQLQNIVQQPISETLTVILYPKLMVPVLELVAEGQPDLVAVERPFSRP